MISYLFCLSMFNNKHLLIQPQMLIPDPTIRMLMLEHAGSAPQHIHDHHAHNNEAATHQRR
jgi:hypothetical protein